MMEEIWQVLGHNESVQLAPWPSYDASKLVEATVEIPVMVNGKKRGIFTANKDASKDDLQKQALELEHVKEFVDGKEIKKIVVVPNKIVNIVAK